MGMSTHVIGFRKPDAKWNKMLAARNACTDAGIAIPDDISDFFEWEHPRGRPGMEVRINEAVTPYSDDMKEGYEVDVSKLPEGVSVVRFYNSY